jgi:uncharacterized membrane protein
MSHHVFVCTSLFRETLIAGFETRSRKYLVSRMAIETVCDPYTNSLSSDVWNHGLFWKYDHDTG